jgi:hypothetical protein
MPRAATSWCFVLMRAAEQLEPPSVNQLKEWAAWAFADPKGGRVELPTLRWTVAAKGATPT